MSDGLCVYWLYHLRSQEGLANPVTGDKIKQFPVFLQQLQVKVRSVCNYNTFSMEVSVACIHTYMSMKMNNLFKTLYTFSTFSYFGFATNSSLSWCAVPQVSSDSSSGSLALQPTGEPVLLQRGTLERDKNSEVVKALVRANPSYASSAAAFSTLLGSSKDDTCEWGEIRNTLCTVLVQIMHFSPSNIPSNLTLTH